MTYMAMPQHKNPWPRAHETYNFDWPFLSQHDYILIFSEHCLGVEKKIFLKKYINYTFFTPKFPPLWVWGHEIYSFFTPYPTNETYQICLRLAQ